MRSTRTRSVATLIAITALAMSACTGATTTSTAPSETATASSAVPTTASSFTAAPGQIVYEDYSIAAGRHQIYIEEADGSNSRRLVTSAFDDARPSLSPDGTTVLFTRYGDGDDKALLVNVDGTNLRPVDNGSCGEACSGDPQGDGWSPDGRQLVVIRAFLPIVADNATNVSVWIINLDGSGAVEVTKNDPGSQIEDNRPGWSPDGKHLVFVRRDYSLKRAAIFTVATDGTDLRQVTPWELDANEPDWSPDGSLIAFNAPGAPFLGGEQNIYTIHPDGTGLRQVTAHLSSAPNGNQGTFDPCWSPDGAQIVFTHIPSTNSLADLFVVNSDGSGLHVLMTTPALNESHANWGVSPSP